MSATEEATTLNRVKEEPEWKVCPLSAGSEIDWWLCVREKCAWWDKRKGQCILVTLAQTLEDISANLEGIQIAMSERDEKW
jgi:hypothetical protein